MEHPFFAAGGITKNNAHRGSVGKKRVSREASGARTFGSCSLVDLKNWRWNVDESYRDTQDASQHHHYNFTWASPITLHLPLLLGGGYIQDLYAQISERR